MVTGIVAYILETYEQPPSKEQVYGISTYEQVEIIISAFFMVDLILTAAMSISVFQFFRKYGLAVFGACPLHAWVGGAFGVCQGRSVVPAPFLVVHH